MMYGASMIFFFFSSQCMKILQIHIYYIAAYIHEAYHISKCGRGYVKQYKRITVALLAGTDIFYMVVYLSVFVVICFYRYFPIKRFYI